jgi:hypothetical protein
MHGSAAKQRWREAEADDIAHLVDEQRIVRQLNI